MLEDGFEGLVDTARGPAFVRVRGRGPRVLVCHGGPGFDQEPLVPALEAIEQYRTLIFFDQLGCGQTPAGDTAVTAEATFAHAAALIDALGPDPIGIVAHSWGCVVAAGLGMMRPGLRFTEALMINPIGLDSGAYADAQAAIMARIPEETVGRMWAMLAEGATGADAFAVLSPYYVASETTRLPPIPVAAPVYASVEASVGAFDFWPALERFGVTHSIRGSDDFVPPTSIRPLLDRTASDVVLPNVGHYAFHENTNEFAAAIDRIFTPS